jgi:hypothetical protein
MTVGFIPYYLTSIYIHESFLSWLAAGASLPCKVSLNEYVIEPVAWMYAEGTHQKHKNEVRNSSIVG